MIRLLLISLLVLVLTPLFAQSRRADSLRISVQQLPVDTAGVSHAIESKSALVAVDQRLPGQLTPDNSPRTGEDQRQWRYATLAGLVLIGFVSALLYRRTVQKRRTNALLQQKNLEIETLREQNKKALTNLRATQRQLVQREKMATLGELTAGIAHEIQNPLNFVNNFSDLSTELLGELEDEQQRAERDPELEAALLTDLKNNLHKILHHGQRASNIVKSMLEHARNSQGQKIPTALNALTDEYLRLAYHGLRAKDPSFNCTLITNFDTSVGDVAVVSQDMGRVLLNLFTNAFYAVQQRCKQGNSTYQPTVTIRTVKTETSIYIQIKDNGLGMPRHVLDKAFQPFFTTKPPGEGTGLGLSLSHDIVTKEHKGTLTVESDEDEGTEFSIGLPI